MAAQGGNREKDISKTRAPVEWKTSASPVAYEEALAFMEARVEGIIRGREAECVWLLEHPPLYTAGTSAKREDLLTPDRFPVYDAGRGGEFTYHGPGQRIAYVMLDLKRRAEARGEEPDLRAFVKQLEAWIIATLAELGIEAFTREGRIGVWVEKRMLVKDSMSESAMSAASSRRPGGRRGKQTQEAKIAALGIRVRKWVTYHGIAINVNPDLSHFNGIVPCGIKEYGVTSIQEMLGKVTRLDTILEKKFELLF